MKSNNTRSDMSSMKLWEKEGREEKEEAELNIVGKTRKKKREQI